MVFRKEAAGEINRSENRREQHSVGRSAQNYVWTLKTSSSTSAILEMPIGLAGWARTIWQVRRAVDLGLSARGRWRYQASSRYQRAEDLDELAFTHGNACRKTELFVANGADDSVLVFKATDEGDAAPIRVLKGPNTGIKHPPGIALDERLGEILSRAWETLRSRCFQLPPVATLSPCERFEGGPVVW